MKNSFQSFDDTLRKLPPYKKLNNKTSWSKGINYDVFSWTMIEYVTAVLHKYESTIACDRRKCTHMFLLMRKLASYASLFSIFQSNS